VLTALGVEAKSGDVFSVASVELRDRAQVFGSIMTGGSVSRFNNTTVTGTVLAHVAVPLPNPLVEFPAWPSGMTTNVTVERGQSRTITPGSYGTITVRGNGQLTLAPGDYFVRSVVTDAQSRLVLGAGHVELAVAQGLLAQGSIDGSDGDVVKYAGSSAVVIEGSFSGELAAPNADVTVRAPYSGRLYARNIVLDADRVVNCVQE
jgi:hypothetical protein